MRGINRRAEGFTLIELMIVVAIIGILAAIAIPNFIRFQAKSKQTEVKGNLKAIFTGERSFRQEHDKVLGFFRGIGFSPERGNRYAYQIGAAIQTPEVRANTDVTPAASDPAGNTVNYIQVDTFKYTTAAAQPALTNPIQVPAQWAVDPGDPGGIPAVTTATCPQAPCSWSATGVGNIDSDATMDQWWIAGTDGSGVTGNCGRDPTETAAPAGEPQLDENDVDC